MPGSAMSSRTELDVRSSLKSQLGSTSRPSAGPTLVSKRVVGVGAGEDDGMSQHDRGRRFAGNGVGFVLQALQHDADQGADAEVDRPAVGSREPELRELVLHPRKKPRVAASAALAVLAAVGVPTVRREGALPAVGLLVAGFQERPDGLVARRAAADYKCQEDG